MDEPAGTGDRGGGGRRTDGSPLTGGTDWARWHAPYADPDSPLSARLAVVRQQVSDALDRAPAGPLRLLRLCAGQGSDVLPVLATHDRGADVTARLVELDPRNAAVARASAGPGTTVVEGDAGTTDACVGSAPADVLLLCGIFGNVDTADVERTLREVPSLLVEGGTVIWTRHRRAPDLTPGIRQELRLRGVAEVAFVAEQGEGWAVGAGVLRGPGRPLVAGRRLFTFSRGPC